MARAKASGSTTGAADSAMVLHHVQGMLLKLGKGEHDVSLTVRSGLKVLVKLHGETAVSAALGDAELWLLEETDLVEKMRGFRREASRICLMEIASVAGQAAEPERIKPPWEE